MNAPIIVKPQGGRVGHMWGIPVFDHQFDPYPGEFDYHFGEFDYHFGPELGQGAFRAQKFGDLRRGV